MRCRAAARCHRARRQRHTAGRSATGPQQLTQALSLARGKRSLSEHLRRHVGLEGVKASLLYEGVDRAVFADPTLLAATIKALPIKLMRPRPIAEAISSSGGVRFAELTADLALHRRPFAPWCG